MEQNPPETLEPELKDEASEETAENGEAAPEPVSFDEAFQEALPGIEPPPQPKLFQLEEDGDYSQLKAILEALVYVTEEPLTPDQIAGVLEVPKELVRRLLEELAADCDRPSRGLWIREVAGGFRMATKPEHHEVVRHFVRKLTKPLKLSPASLETLAVIAYKQPITTPEILAIRGVQGGSAIKTLLDHKLITTAGRKQVIGKPILYRTTRDFLLQFGLNSLDELPTIKEFEELSRLAFDEDREPAAEAAPAEAPPAPEPAAADAAEPGESPERDA
jgi:segregation and condensation protein B